LSKQVSISCFDIEIIIYFLTKTSYLNEEVNCTEPSPSVVVPWTNTLAYSQRKATAKDDRKDL
jgi:hypothetical protein